MNILRRHEKAIFLFFAMIVFVIFQESVFAAVNLQSSAESLADSVQKIGLSVLSVSMIIGGTMMGFGSPKGTVMVIFSIIGGVIVLVASGIISAIQQAVN